MHFRILGYQYSDDGKVEPQDKFLKRMTGIMRLYSAIMVTKLKRSQANKPHPLGINEGWRWLAAMLNLGWCSFSLTKHYNSNFVI